MSRNLLDAKDENYIYAPLAYHDSWLSVDPIVGCRLDCQYCYMQSTRWTATKPEILYIVSEMVEMLIAHRHFVRDETILCFGNQTDPFLPDNVDYTLKFFEALEQRGFNNPLVVVTKKRIPRHFLDRACQLKYVRPIFILSYSGLPKSIERGVNPKENQENFKTLSQLGLCVTHFWRPLIAENGSVEILEEVLELVAQYAMASVYTGLKLNPHFYFTYAKNSHLRLPEELDGQYGDYIPEGVEERLRTLASAKYPNYPMYMHTSCAVSYVLSIPDYTATLYHPVCKASNCPMWKRRICEGARSSPTRQQTQTLLSHLGLENSFTISDHVIEISGEINQEDYAFLLHCLNYPLKAQVKHTRNLWGSIFKQSQ
jgi:DNA repair photolyase